MLRASTTARPSGGAHGTAHTPSSWNASDRPCVAMNPATHSARSPLLSVASSFARSASDTAPGPPASGVEGAPSNARDHSGSRCRTAARHHAPWSSPCQSSATGSATISAGVRPPNRRDHAPSGAASTNWPSHHDRSPRPAGALGTTPSRSIPTSHSCGASTTSVGVPAAVDVLPVRSTATHAVARFAIRPASADAGRADSNSAAVARTLRLRSANAASRKGSSAASSPVRSVSRNISRSSARSVCHVPDSTSRAEAASSVRIAVSRATRSANRPSRHNRRTRSGSSGPGRAAPPPGAARSAKRQSLLNRASHSARAPAKTSTAGRRSVRPRAASSSAGRASGGAA